MIDDDIRRPSLFDPGMGPMPPPQSVSMMYVCSIVYKSYTVGYFMRRETEEFERSLTKASGRYTAARVFGPWMVAAGEAGTAGRRSRGRGLLWSPIRPDATAIHLLATLFPRYAYSRKQREHEADGIVSKSEPEIVWL